MAIRLSHAFKDFKQMLELPVGIPVVVSTHFQNDEQLEESQLIYIINIDNTNICYIKTDPEHTGLYRTIFFTRSPNGFHKINLSSFILNTERLGHSYNFVINFHLAHNTFPHIIQLKSVSKIQFSPTRPVSLLFIHTSISTDLEEVLKSFPNGLPNILATRIVIQLISCIIWYHRNSICLNGIMLQHVGFSHRDLLNIVLKYINTSVYVKNGDDIMRNMFIPYYINTIAPECFSPQTHNVQDYHGFPADIWSLGLLINTIYTGVNICENIQPYIMSNKLDEFILGLQYPPEEIMPVFIKELLQRIFTKSDVRITAMEIYSLPWLQEAYAKETAEDPLPYYINTQEKLAQDAKYQFVLSQQQPQMQQVKQEQ